MRAEFVLDFGVMPDGVLPGARKRPSYESNVRWKLELWRDGAVWQLRHNRAIIEILDLDERIVCCEFARPARGSGYAHISLRHLSNPRSTIFLLRGRFEDLEWLRITAQTLARTWEIGYEEQDYREDD